MYRIHSLVIILSSKTESMYSSVYNFILIRTKKKPRYVLILSEKGKWRKRQSFYFKNKLFRLISVGSDIDICTCRERTY